MEIFPFVLLRLAGLPLDYLDPLHLLAPDWKNLLLRETELNHQSQALRQRLSDVIGTHPDYQAKNTLANLYRDFASGRRLRIHKYQGLFDHNETAKALFQTLVDWQKQVENLAAQKATFQTDYQTQVIVQRAKLQSLLAAPNLLKGLPFASISTYQRLQRYLQKDPASFRKKELQTERTLLQYLTRTVAKTSPFSHFTTLSIQPLRKSNWQTEPHSKIHLNNYLLAYWQTTLERLPGFNRQLELKVNPSWRQEGEGYTFLLNSRNVESIQGLAENPLVEALVELVGQTRLSFEALLVKAMEFVEAAEEEIAQFMLELIDYGVLEWDWPLSGRSAHWLEELQALVAAKEDFAERNEILALLDKLSLGKVQLEQASAAERPAILQEMQAALEAFFTQYLDTEQEVDESESFQRIGVGEFNFRAEKMAYEDVSSSGQWALGEEALQPLIAELDRLVAAMEGMVEWPWEKAVNKHFLEHFGEKESVDLLTFYDSFYRHVKIENNTQAISPELVEPLLDQLREADLCDTQKGICQLPWAFIDQWLPPVPKQGAQSSPAQAALLQISQTGPHPQAFVEANILGYGKMMGRFLHLFPTQLTTEIRQWNQSLQVAEEDWIENVDASYFNANIYPSLLSKELASPGSQSQLPDEAQVALTDLELTTKADGLILQHRPSKRPIRMFNFGLEALGNRSAMYRLLQTFAYRTPSTDLLVQLVDTAYGGEDAQGVLHFPRLQVGERLILKRRRWYFPQALLPRFEKDNAAFFLAVQTWRQQWQLPRHIFIRLSPRQIPTFGSTKSEAENRRNDDYKPQWIDLEQLLVVELLARLLKRVFGYLEVSEMWPAPDQAIPVDGQARAVEALVEWKNASI